MTADWSREMEDAIELPDGRTLLTLRQAGEYVAALPKRLQTAPEWLLAAEMLLLASERRTPLLMARIAFLKALNRDKLPPQAAPRRKPAKVYTIVPAGRSPKKSPNRGGDPP